MRLFTGISLPPEASAPLIALTDHLRPLAKLAWTPVEKLHITTKFIGEWPQSRLPELQQVLSMVSSSKPVDVRIRGLGWMPNARSPLTLYAGVELTGDLAGQTENLLDGLGILRETRTYRPHATLGRIRRAGRDPIDALQQEVAATTLDIAPFRAAAFHLYLSANGTYTKLSDYPLPQ
jgi:RNA 2',3'-cyclic 3'-phosphodiesterase